MAKRPTQPRQADTFVPSVPEPPGLESLADQATRLAREWGLPDQERQIYEVLAQGKRHPHSTTRSRARRVAGGRNLQANWNRKPERFS